MKDCHFRQARPVCLLLVGMFLIFGNGCISLDYADWNTFNDTVIDGAFDGAGTFVEDTVNMILTSIYDVIVGIPGT